MFTSSRHLHLELLCTHGTPVEKDLGYLPSFPIVISFLNHLLDGDGDGIIAALEHRDRIRAVEIKVPHSLFEELATAMQEPLPALTHLLLESDRFVEMPTLPDTFLGGSAPLLEAISVAGISFPAAPTLLSSARNLVDVDLREMPPSGYILPEAMVASLAALPKLKYLNLEFEWGMSYDDRIRLPSTRTVLPALTRFFFDGLFEYLEDFVAQIDAPQLDFLHIWYLEQAEGTDYQIPQLSRFVDRSEILKSSRCRRADVLIEPCTGIIELSRRGQPFRLSIQEDVMGQVVDQLSILLSNVDRLFIRSAKGLKGRATLGAGIRWLELFRSFTAVKVLSIDDELSCYIPLALNSVTDERAAEVLPALKLLCLENESMTSMKKFVAARQNVGCPVTFINKEREFKERLNPLLNSLDDCEY